MFFRPRCPKRSRAAVRVATLGVLFLIGVRLIYLRHLFALEPLFSSRNRAVTLLVWTHPFGRARKLPDCFALYRIGGCTITDDWSAYSQADAVIIHHREVGTGAADLPTEPRPRAQKWIWLNYESPAHTPGLWRMEGVFNLTMTYRTDSDIFLPYGYLVPLARTREALQNSLARPLRVPPRARLLRPRLLAWVISNWSESHARVSFYYQLRQHVQVDVFGRAGRPVPRDGDGGGGSGSGSVVRLLGRYQFYLALENSQHTDYVTEKLWNAVLAGAVPVVLGPSRRNYERFLPPEAFIHADDFPTARGLARYLLLLWRDPARLSRHLEWRRGYGAHQPAFWAEHYCASCRAVRRTRTRSDVVTDLSRWFNS
ncbi:alpha-(1,3)-fucosyltransferase 4-like [Brachionichthys hirsutus]|uniref:alpha-(1,3)-fucosyltransferase 4-like n=1 Tax=Brachionichthys hirsutus TaxID=412623 RepID=UPI0036045649